MKNFNIRVLFILLCTGCLFTTSFAQQTETSTEKEGKKKIVIITKKVDDDGKVITEKIVKEGKDAEMIFIESIDEVDLEREVDVNVELEDDNESKHVKIKIIKDGKPEVIEWRGDGEMPEAFEYKLKKEGVNIHTIDGDHTIMIGAMDDFKFRKPSVCLGVHIGHKIEIENIDGVETQTETGTSEDGVSILDIVEDSGAEAAGLLADDVITAINGTEVNEIDDVLNALEDLEPGTSVSVNFLRNGNAQQTNATLGDCGDAMNIKLIKKDIEFEGEDINIDSDGNRMVIIKKRYDGEPNEIVEWEDTEFGELSAEQFENTLEVEALDIFPNPSSGEFRVQFEAPAEETTVRVIDLSGKQIYKEQLNNFDGFYNKELDLRKAGKGGLILSIQQKDKVFSERIILQ